MVSATLEELSHKLLGGYHRLRFAALVAAMPAEFATAEIVVASSRSSTAISKELKHFADAGVLHKRGHGKWLRLHDDFWIGCAGLLGSLQREQGPSVSQGTRGGAHGRERAPQ